MIQSSLFSPYQKRVSSSRRKLKKITHQPKPIKQQPQQLFKIPILKAFGERIFLSRNTEDSRFIKKPTFLEDTKDQRNKMILIAKKIGCYIDPPLYLQGLREFKKQEGKSQSKRQRDREEGRDDKREIKELQSTINDSQLRISRLKPSSVSIQASRVYQSFPKTINSITEQKINSSKYITYLILSSRNNEELIRKILSTRKNWKEIKKGEGSPNFRWLAGDYDHAVFEKAKSTTFMKKVVNQFQFHHQITTKNGLIRNLQLYTETKKLELFSMTPITFVIDFDEEYCEFNIRQFLNFFIKNSTKQKQQTGSVSPSKAGNNSSYQRINSFIDKLRPYFNPHPELRKKLNPLSRPDMKSEYINGDSYLWLLKPTGLNRGRGIQIFDNLEDLQSFFLNYLSLAGRKPISSETNIKSAKKQSLGNISTLPSLSNQQMQNATKRTSNQQFVLKACSFVIQKYIQKPMLIDGRKFDIRVWVFLNYDFSLYFFKQGYLRLSSEQFSLDVNNYFIHLTNNAIQKHSKEYGSIEQGNQLSFQTFKQYLIQQNCPDEFESILSKIKQYSYTSLSSVKNKLNPKQQKYCFQLFGFDYIIDYNYKVWLIEVNNNPCIQLSSPLLGKLIPRMLNDAFKISTDRIFKAGKDYNPEKGTEGQKEKQEEEREKQTFSVDGYHDNQNMWEPLGKLSPNSQYTPK